MLIKEYRVVLPISIEEYHVGQLFCVAEASKGETGGGNGVEILLNEPFNPTCHNPTPPLFAGDEKYTTGQYTLKHYHISQKVPRFLSTIIPTSALILTEHAWNSFPYCRTVLTNNFLKEKFTVTIESLHVDTDINLENPHHLPPEEWAKVEVVYIDIGDISPSDRDYREDEDPSKFRSEKTNRGPLKPRWWETGDYTGPIMCAYKLVKTEVNSWTLPKRLEGLVHRMEHRLFANFHRQVFCWIDKWHGLTIDDIRMIEEHTKEELEKQRKDEPLRGHTADE